MPVLTQHFVACLLQVMVAGMGGLQGAVHKLFYGRPKPHGTDDWDRLVEARDERLKKEGL